MTRRDTWLVLALGVLLVVLVVAQAAPVSAPAPSPTPAPTEEPAPAFREGIVGQPSSPTPISARTQADRDIVALVFRGLVRLGPGQAVLPDLAARWESSDAGRRWLFVLRDDATWQNGEPVTSDDVLFTVRALQASSSVSPRATTWRLLTATAIDRRTIQFELASPVAGFLEVATQPLLPAHQLEAVPVDALVEDPFWRAPIGTGPFQLVQWDEKQAILEPVVPHEGVLKQPFATFAALGPTGFATPLLPRLEMHFYATPEELAAAYQAGEVDSASGLPGTIAAGIAGPGGAKTLRYPGTTLTTVVLNLRARQQPAFADPRTRRALLASIDRNSIVKTVLAGAGSRADSPIPPTSWAFDRAASRPIAYDPDAAARDLRAAGWTRTGGSWTAPGDKKEFAVELLSPDEASNRVAHEIAREVARSWTTLGLKVTLTELPAAEFVSRLRQRTFAAAVADVNVGLDPDLYPLLASSQARTGGSNVAGVQDAAVDRALEAVRDASSEAKRKTALGKLQQVLVERLPILPIAFRDSLYVVPERLQGPTPRPLSDASGRFWDVLTWRLADR